MEQTDKLLKFFLVTGRMEKQITKIKSLYMKDLGLNGSDLPVLFALLSNAEGCRQDQLCQVTGSDKAQISRSLGRLSDASLIEKEPGSLYKSRYRLTVQGKAAAGELAKKAVHIFDQAHEVLKDEEWDGFYNFLMSLNEQVDTMIRHKECSETEEN